MEDTWTHKSAANDAKDSKRLSSDGRTRGREGAAHEEPTPAGAGTASWAGQV